MPSTLMSLLFGKKKRKTTKSRKVSKKQVIKKPKGLTKTLVKLARKHRVKVRLMRNGKHIGYRKVSHIKRDIRRKIKKEKLQKKRDNKKHTKKTRRSRARKSMFGVGGSYMPLSSFMSPYPYSVNSSPPWV